MVKVLAYYYGNLGFLAPVYSCYWVLQSSTSAQPLFDGWMTGGWDDRVDDRMGDRMGDWVV